MTIPRPIPCTLALVVAWAAPVRGQTEGAGLLERLELQAVVDLQVARDGAGLVARLSDSDATVRARAAFALGSVQDRDAVPALLALLDDLDSRVQADAAFALGQTADSTAEGALLSALNESTNKVVRYHLLGALGKTGGSASLARLAALEVPPGDRGALALAIARYGIRDVFDPAAVERLLGFLAPGKPGTETGLAEAAYFFGRVPDTLAWAGSADRLRAALDAGIGEMHLVLALGRLTDPQDDDRLIAALDHADWRVRVNAARALAGRTVRAAVQEALLAALDDLSTHVAVVAATTLSGADSLDLETERAIAQRFLQRPEPWQVSAALGPAVVRSGAAGVVILRLTGIAGGGAGDVPAGTAALLAALGLDNGRPGFLVLEDAADDEDPRIAAAALGALGDRWRRGVVNESATVEAYYAAFSAALRRRDLATASAAAPLLADSLFRPLGGVPLLADVYRRMRAQEEIEPMVEVLKALGESGDPAAGPALRGALGHPHPVIRRAAEEGLAALTGKEEPSAVDASAAAAGAAVPPERRVDWEFLRGVGSHPRLILETERGRIHLELSAEEAPLTVQTVLQFAIEGRYDGVPFHRVVPNFVIQGGDFARGDGYGGPGFAIGSEFTRIQYERGTVGMASAGKDTEGSQYFITHSMQPHLDGRYTAFGRVIEGMDVVDRILEGDHVLKASIEPDSR
ncbi:peptidylprolyl isomerase [soil metagenome]